MRGRDGADGARAPAAADAARAVRRALGVDVETITRFPTGHSHYVYDVTTTDGQRVVARLARPDTQSILAGGVYWHERLRDVGVPVPALLYADAAPADGFPVMLLERLPGCDLGDVYADLNTVQRRVLAWEVADIQARVATLPRAAGFGFALSYDDPDLHHSWLDVVLADVERTRGHIAAAGLVALNVTERVLERVLASATYLRAIEPVPFLDDTTTKNVLVHNGTLCGIVDTDHVCFGDPIFAVALTRMALLAHAQSTDYIDYWLERLALSDAQSHAMDLYTAVFCAGFLGEIGLQFNQETPRPVDSSYQRHLEALLNTLLA